MCYGRNKGFNHDHRTCPIHKADTEAYKKVHGSKKRAPAGIRDTKVEVDKDELSKLILCRRARLTRARSRKKNQENDAQPEKIKRKIVFSGLRNPPNNFTPLFGEVAETRTLTEKEEQQSRDGDEVERCLPQNT